MNLAAKRAAALVNVTRRYWRRREQGLCGQCGRPARPYARCLRCRKARANADQMSHGEGHAAE